MRRYYLLAFDQLGHQYQCTARVELGYFDPTVLLDGKPYNLAIPASVNLYVSYGRMVDYLPNPLQWPICSRRFADVIEARAARDVDIQIIDAPLIAEGTGRPIGDFYVVNLLRHIECLDLSASDLIMDEDVVDMVIEHVFDSSKIPEDLHIFRPLEYPYHIVVSEQLAQDIMNSNLKGMVCNEAKSS